MEQPQLADAQHQVALRLGGLTKDWRFDRMSTVVHPATGKVTASYAAIAKHFGVRVRPCPPRRGNRKGVVEKANHTAAQRWWRSLPDDVTTSQAQAMLDRFCEQVTDQRRRNGSDGTRCTAADLAAAERLRPVLKSAPIAVITVARQATAQALVHYRGNRYSLPPELAGNTVTVTHRAGGTTLAIVTNNGVTVAVHPRRADGTGAIERTDTHVTALNTAALTASTSAAPHRSKQRIPPGPDARAAAAALRANNPASGPGGSSSAPVIDLAVYGSVLGTDFRLEACLDGTLIIVPTTTGGSLAYVLFDFGFKFVVAAWGWSGAAGRQVGRALTASARAMLAVLYTGDFGEFADGVVLGIVHEQR